MNYPCLVAIELAITNSYVCTYILASFPFFLHNVEKHGKAWERGSLSLVNQTEATYILYWVCFSRIHD